jgi:hypothetical protein
MDYDIIAFLKKYKYSTFNVFAHFALGLGVDVSAFWAVPRR